MTFLDRRWRRTQLETLLLVACEGPLSAEDIAAELGGDPESLGRRLRRYRRRGWLGVHYGGGGRGPQYFLRERGAARAHWIRAGAQTRRDP